MATNTENLASTVMAAFCLGCPVNHLVTTLGKNEIKHMLSKVTPNLILCDANVHGLLTECLQEMEIDANIITIDEKIEASEYIADLFVASDLEASYT